MNEDYLRLLHKEEDLALYEIVDREETTEDDGKRIVRLLASTPGTRQVCNDPLIAGTRYTDRLKKACTSIFEAYDFGLVETEVVVLNILRGALNFGLRDALAAAYGWWRHNSSFISAQRARDKGNRESWHITEKGYKKIYFPASTSLVIGDVVATGTSLHFAMGEIIKAAMEQKCMLKNIVFFTYGGRKAEEIFEEIDSDCRELFRDYRKTYVVYIEGRFTVPDLTTPLSIRLTGTDLVRWGSLMAPEFVESQYEAPSYPLERCIIYDAGSRAFWLQEYVLDVVHYWRQTLELAQSKFTFETLLKERFPELDASRFGDVDLRTLAKEQIEKMEQAFKH